MQGAWQEKYLFGPGSGPLRGYMETVTSLGSSVEGVPTEFLISANNIALNPEGRPMKRPGRGAVANFGSPARVSPAWVGTEGTLLYDGDTAQLRQANTSVTNVFAGNPGAMVSTVYTTAAGTTYLIVANGSAVRKITGTTATTITGIPSSTPDSVCAAGNRLFAADGNVLYWSIPYATGGAAGEWPTDNTLSLAIFGLSAVTAMVEFQGTLYVYGSGAVLAVDPRDPLGTAQNIVLSDFGISTAKCVVKAKDAIYFTDTTDVWRWTPGFAPVSIASLKDGRALVKGTIADSAASDPFNVLGYDGFRDVLFLSNSTTTLVYDINLGAWCVWGFGASAWAFLSRTVYLTLAALTETLKLDWTVYQDTIAGAASQFELHLQTGPFRTKGDSEVCLKNLLIDYPSGGLLSNTSITIGISRNGQGIVDTRTADISDSGSSVWDTATWDTSLWSSSSGDNYVRVPFGYPQGRTLCVDMRVTDNNPFLVNSILGELQPRHVRAAS